MVESAEVLRAASVDQELTGALAEVASSVCYAIRSGAKVLLCGNGGSAADAQHLAGELVGRFRREREGYTVLSMASDASVVTALANDYGYDEVFSRQVTALAKPGDVVMGFSTSGNSMSIVKAIEVASDIGCTTVGWTGAHGGKLADVADIVLRAPANETRLVQDVHGGLIHALCEAVEAELLGEWTKDDKEKSNAKGGGVLRQGA